MDGGQLMADPGSHGRTTIMEKFSARRGNQRGYCPGHRPLADGYDNSHEAGSTQAVENCIKEEGKQTTRRAATGVERHDENSSGGTRALGQEEGSPPWTKADSGPDTHFEAFAEAAVTSPTEHIEPKKGT